MIKINCINAKELSDAYLIRLKLHNFRGSNPILHCYIQNFDKIILARASEYEQLNEQFQELYDLYPGNYPAFKKYMSNQYVRMCSAHGYWLAKALNVNTCPYCNRQYTFTIDRHKKIRPQFDHFFSKSRYPHLALSFYNLIPCCPTCNHIKSDSAEKLIYPYSEGFHDKYGFKVNHCGFMLNKEKIELEIDAMNECDAPFVERCKNSITTFALKELYGQHTDYIEEIILKAYAYNEDYYEGLAENFSKLGKNRNEIHRLIFGNYIDRANSEQRPLSKLTSDLLAQIGILE